FLAQHQSPDAIPFPYTTLFRSIRTGLLLGRLPFDQGERMRMIQERLVQPEQDLRRQAGLDEHGRLLGESAFDRTLVLDMVPTSLDRKSTRLNSSHVKSSYAVFR